MVLPELLRFRLDASTDLPQDTIRVKSDGSAPVAPPPAATGTASTSTPGPAPQGAAPSSTDACLSQLPIFLVFGVVMYFFILRPAQKQEKVRRELLAKMKRGDRVVTSGGLHGVIANITDDTVQVKVDSDVTLTFDRSAIAKVAGDEVPKDTKKP
jgi:preprotein translocase subunit YajC